MLLPLWHLYFDLSKGILYIFHCMSSSRSHSLLSWEAPTWAKDIMTLTGTTWHPDLCCGSVPSCGPSCPGSTSIFRPPPLCTGRLRPDSPGPRAGPRGGPRPPGPCAVGPGSVRWLGGRWGPVGAGEWAAVGGSAAGPGAEGGLRPRMECAPRWRQTTAKCLQN